MPSIKFSQIAMGSTPALTDTFIGVQGGTTDAQYTGTQLGSMLSLNGVVIRQKLSAPLTLYVNPSNTTGALFNGVSGGIGNDSNPGTLASPFLTPNKALSVALKNYDVSQAQITIQYADNNVTGAVYPQLQMVSNLVGAISGGNAASSQLIIQGNSTTPSNVIVQGSGGVAAFGFVGVTSPVCISNMQIGATLVGGATSGHGIQSDAHSMVYYSNITFGFISTGWSHCVATYGSFIEQEGVEKIIGGASLHWNADRVSQILLSGNTVTITGTPAFASAFIGILNGSVFNLGGSSFVGSATGTRYICDNTSSFGSGTADPNSVFPGNANGSVSLPSDGLSGLMVGNGGPPTGATGPVTAMPAMNGAATLNLSTGALSLVAGQAFAATLTNPTGTSSTAAQVMMGLGNAWTLTPARSTRVMIVLSGQISNNTGADGAFGQMRFGTGTAPVNGAAATGTPSGNFALTGVTANTGYPFSVTFVVTGLTPGTAYWFDAGLQALTGGTATLSNLTAVALEV